MNQDGKNTFIDHIRNYFLPDNSKKKVKREI